MVNEKESSLWKPSGPLISAYFLVLCADKAFSIRPNIVHAYDFDSAVPVYLYKKVNRGVFLFSKSTIDMRWLSYRLGMLSL